MSRLKCSVFQLIGKHFKIYIMLHFFFLTSMLDPSDRYEVLLHRRWNSNDCWIHTSFFTRNYAYWFWCLYWSYIFVRSCYWILYNNPNVFFIFNCFSQQTHPSPITGLYFWCMNTEVMIILCLSNSIVKSGTSWRNMIVNICFPTLQERDVCSSPAKVWKIRQECSLLSFTSFLQPFPLVVLVFGYPKNQIPRG